VRFERYLHENDIEHTLCEVGRPMHLTDCCHRQRTASTSRLQPR
jgi:hypothetical protein